MNTEALSQKHFQRRQHIVSASNAHVETYLDKREFNIIKYDQNDPKPGKVHFYIEENITTLGEPPEDPKKLPEYREKLPKDYETFPWTSS